jgi:hypothetical protein
MHGKPIVDWLARCTGVRLFAYDWRPVHHATPERNALTCRDGHAFLSGEDPSPRSPWGGGPRTVRQGIGSCSGPDREWALSGPKTRCLVTSSGGLQRAEEAGDVGAPVARQEPDEVRHLAGLVNGPIVAAPAGMVAAKTLRTGLGQGGPLLSGERALTCAKANVPPWRACLGERTK